MAEFANSQLPWRRIVDKEKVRATKAGTPLGDLWWRNMPSETAPFVDHLQTMDFHSAPDYQLVDRAFLDALHALKVRRCSASFLLRLKRCTVAQVTQKTLFDWETGDDALVIASLDEDIDDNRSLHQGHSE